MPTLELFASSASTRDVETARLWMPQQVQYTLDALLETHGQAIYKGLSEFGIPTEELPRNRSEGLCGVSSRTCGLARTMNLKDEARAALIKGSGAAIAAALATMVCDKRENGEWWRAVNAVSHMIRGNEAKAQSHFSARYTLPALRLHFTSICGWAFCHRVGMLLAVRANPAVSTHTRKSRALALGFAVSALAYTIDFYLVPPRLRPGIETQLSRSGLVFVYLVLALSLAAFGENNEA